MDNRIIQPERALKPAIIVGLQKNTDSHEKTVSELEELGQLLATLGIATAAQIIQKQRTKLSPSHLLGLGKVEEICELVLTHSAGLVVIDHPLTGPQIRNLESLTKCQVLDKTAIILDIFAKHAHSNYAKTQVEIAQLEYLLPHLAGAWTHFGKQKGGGINRGMGEKQIEVDRRRARDRIARLNRKLEQISIEKAEQRKKRQNELKVSLVGYTNCGKTTIMKGLTRSLIEGKNELFATLDASVRVLDPGTRPRILLSDTVGFIRNLPHSLVVSFKSTLEEVVNADLLLHVVDVSIENYAMQIETTNAVLAEIGAKDIPTILLFNKVDQCQEVFLPKILKRNYPNSLVISALDAADILKLREHIFSYFLSQFDLLKIELAVVETLVLSKIHQSCVILSEDYEKEGWVSFTLRVPKSLVGELSRFEVGRSNKEFHDDYSQAKP